MQRKAVAELEKLLPSYRPTIRVWKMDTENNFSDLFGKYSETVAVTASVLAANPQGRQH